MTTSGSNGVAEHSSVKPDVAAKANECLQKEQARPRVEAVQTSGNEDGDADDVEEEDGEVEEEDDEEVESSEDSDEGSDFDEDACSASEPDSSTEVPLKEEEVDELIDELLVVESKAAEAQEKLEEESLTTLMEEVKEELVSEFSGFELDKAVEDELLTYKEMWQEALDELEDQSALVQERLDDAGVDLTSLFKWIEKQAPQFCTTEAWKKRVHWAGLRATEEADQAMEKAENDLQLQRPVKRHRGKLIEEGASGYLQKKVLPIEASTVGCQAVAPSGDGWGAIDSLIGNEDAEEKSIGFGSRAWASVYLAATPEQAARLGLPGADQVEEIVDLEKCNDVHTAAALASEKESGLTESQKKNIKKVGEEDDIKRARLMDHFILKRKKKKKPKLPSSASTGSTYLHPEVAGQGMGAVAATLSMSEGGALPGENDMSECKARLNKATLGVSQGSTLGPISDLLNSFSGTDGGNSSAYTVNDRAICLLEQGNQKGLKRNREDQTSDFPSKVAERVIIDIDSDEDQASVKLEKAVFAQEQPAVSVPFESDLGLQEPSRDMANKDPQASNGGLDSITQHSKGLEKNLDSCKEISSASFICTACGEKLRCDQVYKHPVFDVCICRGCRKFYRSGPISKDINGRDNECSWCGNGGQVIMCELCDKVFCVLCIKRNFGEQEVERILNAYEWLCYCCDPEPLTPKIACFMEASELCSRQQTDSESSDKEEHIELRRVEKRRKRLRRILEDDELEESTILKQRLEKERKERLERLRESAAASSSNSMLTSTSLEECPINVARDADEEEVLIPSAVAKYLKPHQIEGIRFMWENCIESIKKVKAGDPGNGCILAHHMGLGKTLQVIAFLYTVLKRKDLGLRTALIVTPVNVLLNWPDEFAKWKPADMKKLRVYVLDETSRNVRKSLLQLWHKTGGVMMVGYSAFRTMSLGKFSKNAYEKEEICKALQNPGPDILVCDEAHMIKNKQADITQALKQVRTQRRIALTGSPLQNNLMEYYCMVDFVREGFLGRPQDFKNRFQNPIENGQHADSTEYDVRCMKERTHVLHRQLMGFVQRKGSNVVEKELPKKFIYVISVRLSQLQRALYNRFVQTFWLSNEQSLVSAKYHKSLFPTYHALAKVWNHPDLLFTAKEEKEILSDDSMDDILDAAGLSSDDESKKEDKRVASRNHKKLEPDGLNMIESLDWCKDLVGDKPQGLLDNSGKLVLLLEILSMSSARREKALVFSQSIPTLNLIESFLEKIPRPGGKPGYWRRGKEWYRLDGQTKARDRQKLVKQFNDPCNSKVQCVVISTKAGSLGINLQAANRVIIVDGSWNPTHDIQALFRAWRFGQKKPVVVYRLLAYGTAEEKIYKRQVAKEGLAARVLDAQQVGRHSKMEELKVLFKLDEDASSDRAGEWEHLNCSAGAADHDAPDDEIMTSLLIDHRPKWIVRLHQHETLLVDREDERLTLEEQALAWEKFRRITESTDMDWVQANADGGDTSSGPHMHNSWAFASPGPLPSLCSPNFHVELLRSSAIRNNEHVKCDTCQQNIGWEHIIKGRQSRGLHWQGYGKG